MNWNGRYSLVHTFTIVRTEGERAEAIGDWQTLGDLELEAVIWCQWHGGSLAMERCRLFGLPLAEGCLSVFLCMSIVSFACPNPPLYPKQIRNKNKKLINIKMEEVHPGNHLLFLALQSLSLFVLQCKC